MDDDLAKELLRIRHILSSHGAHRDSALHEIWCSANELAGLLPSQQQNLLELPVLDRVNPYSVIAALVYDIVECGADADAACGVLVNLRRKLGAAS